MNTMFNITDTVEQNREIINKIKLLRKEILLLKIKKSYENFRDTSQIRKNKKQIARLITIMNNK